MEHTVKGVKIDNATGMPAVPQNLRWKVEFDANRNLRILLQKKFMLVWKTVDDGYPKYLAFGEFWNIYSADRVKSCGPMEITLGAVAVYKHYDKSLFPDPGREFVGVYPPKSL